MQGAMKVICVVVFLVATSAAVPVNLCPKIQEFDWEIEVLLPHRECDKFYRCTNGNAVEMSCPRSLFYNVIDEVCEWRDLVDCSGRLIPEDKEPEITPGPVGNDTGPTDQPDFSIANFHPNGCPVDPEAHWLLPHENVCKFFYYCGSGERELRSCPHGLYFNKQRQVCDWPWNATCKRTTEKQ